MSLIRDLNFRTRFTLFITVLLINILLNAPCFFSKPLEAEKSQDIVSVALCSSSWIQAHRPQNSERDHSLVSGLTAVQSSSSQAFSQGSCFCSPMTSFPPTWVLHRSGDHVYVELQSQKFLSTRSIRGPPSDV